MLFALLLLASMVMVVVFAAMWIVRKVTRKPTGGLFKATLISVAACLVFFVLTGVTASSEDSDIPETAAVESTVEATTEAETTVPETTEEATTEAAVDEKEELQKKLKDEYGVSPSGFVRGDVTDRWRISKVANGTPPSDYALDYAKAYMTEGDVHFIVNFTLKTTTQFTMVAGILEARTTEYVDKEEHDAKVIGGGLELSNRHFRVATGEEITADADESAGTVSADQLIADVTEAIQGAVGSSEKITGVTFDGSDLKITVDESNADTSILPVSLIAEGSVASISDEILALDDAHYNTWTTVTIDFGEVGSITMDKSIVKNEGFGRYFAYEPGCFN